MNNFYEVTIMRAEINKEYIDKEFIELQETLTGTQIKKIKKHIEQIDRWKIHDGFLHYLYEKDEYIKNTGNPVMDFKTKYKKNDCRLELTGVRGLYEFCWYELREIDYEQMRYKVLATTLP